MDATRTGPEPRRDAARSGSFYHPSSERQIVEPTVAAGSVLVYRVFDVADEIDIAQAERALQAASGTPGGRVKLAARDQSRHAIVMRNPPLRVSLGETQLRIAGGPSIAAPTQATVWDYGAISVLFELPIAPGTPWSELIARSALLNRQPAAGDAIEDAARARSTELLGQLGAAVKRPSSAGSAEDYVIFFLQKVQMPDGSSARGVELLERARMAELVLGEGELELADKSRDGLRDFSLQYAADDLVMIDWNSAIVLEPSGDRDVADVLEFAQTHLLELRYYDGLLDRRLADLYDAVELRRGRGLWRARIARISRDAKTQFLEFSELVERVDNSLKVVGDFYLAVVFRAAVRRFRILDWQSSVSRKMNLMAQLSELLQGEIDVSRGHMLELVIIALIAFEIVSAVFRSV